MQNDKNKYFVAIYDQGEGSRMHLLFDEKGSMLNLTHLGLRKIISIAEKTHGIEESLVTTEIPEEVMEKIRAKYKPSWHIYSVSHYRNRN